MASKTFCDICSKVLPRNWESLEKQVHVGGLGGGYRDYCLDCWKDKKNWKRIHKVVSKETLKRKN